MTASLFVIYPQPADPASFDRRYREEHLPLASTALTGVTGVTTHPVLGTPSGAAPYHLITEVRFASMEALEQCAASDGGRRTFAHAASLSTGGPPLLLISTSERRAP